MKLALIFLASFIGLSCQEKYTWPIAPRAHLLPLFRADDAQENGAADDKALDEKGFPLISLPVINLPNILPSISFPQITITPVFTFTATVTSTITSTVSATTSVKCIPPAQFSSSTTACARRRREVDGPISLLEMIQPNQPAPLEVSQIEPLPLADEAEGVTLPPPEIKSSHEEEPAMMQIQPLENRNLRNLTTTVLVTVPTTQFSTVPVTVKVTASVGTTGGLLCLPSGYVVC